VPDEYDATIYDLDGTLVELDVDWGEVAHSVAAVLSARGVDPEGADLWEMFELARQAECFPSVDDRVAEFERDGARGSRRLPLASELPRREPVGVVSLNAESACRIALEVHGLDSAVATVIGRDTVGEMKPHPLPLQRALADLGVAPERALFVGDSESDAEAARRAGMDFQWVSDRLGQD